jgi:hypothetical protein
MSGKGYVITAVELDWKDNGNSYWTVFFTKADGSQWCLRVQARDELDAYTLAMNELEGAS